MEEGGRSSDVRGRGRAVGRPRRLGPAGRAHSDDLRRVARRDDRRARRPGNALAQARHVPVPANDRRFRLGRAADRGCRRHEPMRRRRRARPAVRPPAAARLPDDRPQQLPALPARRPRRRRTPWRPRHRARPPRRRSSRRPCCSIAAASMSVGFLLVRGGFDLPVTSPGASQIAVATTASPQPTPSPAASALAPSTPPATEPPAASPIPTPAPTAPPATADTARRRPRGRRRSLRATATPSSSRARSRRTAGSTPSGRATIWSASSTTSECRTTPCST